MSDGCTTGLTHSLAARTNRDLSKLVGALRTLESNYEGGPWGTADIDAGAQRMELREETVGLWVLEVQRLQSEPGR